MEGKTKNKIILLIIFLAAFDVLIWRAVIAGGAVNSVNPEIYFMDVGQGDSEFIVLPSSNNFGDRNIKILIDGGPNGQRLSEQLAKILPVYDRYIDLVILSHPQADHFTGLIDIFRHYKVGAFISNGVKGTAKSFRDLESAIEKDSVRKIILLAGDSIKYKDNVFDIISPKPEFLDLPDFNHGCLVILMKAAGASAMFTGDIGFEEEKYLMKNYDINIDILKVAHHGSKYSSEVSFLTAASPKISVIEVGKNSYGHPTKAALSRLTAVGSKIFRTDKDSTVKLEINAGKLLIFKNKNL